VRSVLMFISNPLFLVWPPLDSGADVVALIKGKAKGREPSSPLFVP
jgi:hypothetical protein